MIDMTYGWNPLGNALLMYCTHTTRKYQSDTNPVPLSTSEEKFHNESMQK